MLDEEHYVNDNSDHQILGDLKTEYQYGWSQPENYAFKSAQGLGHEIVGQISTMKGEPGGCASCATKRSISSCPSPSPLGAQTLSGIDFRTFYYYIKPTEAQGKSWDDVPADIGGDIRQAGHPGGGAQVPGGVECAI